MRTLQNWFRWYVFVQFTENMELGEDEHHFLFMQRLSEKALEMADISFERAFAIDDSVMGKQVEDYAFMSLMEKFYKKVYEDSLLR